MAKQKKQQVKKTEKILEEKPIVENLAVNIPEGMVIVIGSKQSGYLTTGKEYEVHSKLAKTLINKGQATLK